MFIYLIVNRVTGKYYVGQHKGNNLKKYLQQKFYDAWKNPTKRSHLHASIRKYGRGAFSIHALISDIQTKEELDQKEKEFIAFLHSRDHNYGYNICRGGEGFTVPHSEETKRKNSENSLATWQNPEIRARRVKNQKQVRDSRGGTFLTTDSVIKIKVARAAQDETPRIEGCRKWVEEHKEEASTRLSHEAHVLGGKAGSKEDKQKAGRLGAKRGGPKARHVRWHTNRNIVSPNCQFCKPLTGM